MSTKLSRSFNWFVLFCFYFQTLWPTVVFAKAQKDGWKEHEGVAFKARWKSNPDEIEPRFHVKAYVTAPSQDGETEGKRLRKTLLDRSLTLSEFQAFRRGKTLYSDLERTQEGALEFSFEGLTFRTDIEGNVLLEGDGSETLVNIPVRIQSDGIVGLGAGLRVRHVLAKGKHVLVHSPDVAIERLDVWASGGDHPIQPDVHVEGQLFIPQDHTLTLQTLYLHEGQLENEGILNVLEDGFVDLKENDLRNQGTISLGKNALIRGGKVIANYGDITGELFRISGRSIHNEGKISGIKASLIAQTSILNYGTIEATQTASAVSFGSLQNYGTIKSDSEQFVSVKGHFYNRGTLSSPKHTLRVFGQTVNEGVINGSELITFFADLRNRNTIEASQSLTGTIGKGFNGGLIKSLGSFALTITELFKNERFIQSDGSMVLEVLGTYYNQGETTSGDTLQLKGQGTVINTGTIKGVNDTSVETAIVHNRSSLVSDANLRLRSTKLFHNHSNAKVGAGGTLTVSGEGTIINEATEGQIDIETAEDLVFEDFTGTLENKGHIKSQKQVKGKVQKLVNRGHLESDQGFTALWIVDLLNLGTMLGEGELTVTTGTNIGTIQGRKLALIIHELFTNQLSEEGGVFKFDESLIVRGNGTLINRGLLSAPSLTLATKEIENYFGIKSNSIVVMSSVYRLFNGQDALLETDTFHVKQGPGGPILNQGVLTAKQLTLDRSLHNKGTITTDALVANTDLLKNGKKGTLTVKHSLSGLIRSLINKNKFILEGDTHLTGTSLTNSGWFHAKGIFDWIGETLFNEEEGDVLIFDNLIQVKQQLINKSLIRWTHNTFRASHILNMGWMERTKSLKVARPAFTVSTDQSTTYKKGTVENRGTVLMHPTDYTPRMDIKSHVRFSHWHNAGTMEMGSWHLKAKSVDNTGTVRVHGDLTGTAETFKSTNQFLVKKALSLTGQTLDLAGRLEAEKEISYHGQTLITRGSVITLGRFTTVLSGALINHGTIQADQGFDWKIHSLQNHGHLIGLDEHFQGQVSQIHVATKITTAKDSTLTAFGLDLTAEDLEHVGSLALASKGKLTVKRIRNLGQIGRTKETLYHLLEIVADSFSNDGIIGFYDLILTLGNLTSTAKAKFVAANRLALKLRSSYTHYGLMQAKDLDYQAQYWFSTLANRGKIIATDQSLIRADFKNELGSEADLTGLTLEEGIKTDEYLFNDGILKLRRLKSLGAALRHLFNGHKAELVVDDCGYSYGVPEGREGHELKYGGFAFSKVTNYGTIGFGRGTYHIRGDFENHGIHEILRGQDLWYYDLINHGEIKSDRYLHIDHTRANVTKLGKVTVKGKLLLELHPSLDAAKYLLDNAPNWTLGTLHYRAPTFHNWHKLAFAFPFIVTAGDFHNYGLIHSKQIEIYTNSFAQGREESDGWGNVNTTHGEIKAEEKVKIEVQGEVNNRLGRIKSEGTAEITSLYGDIVVGKPLPAGNNWNVRNGAFISAEGDLTLSGNEVRAEFGDIASYGNLHIKARRRIHNLSGIIKVFGNARFTSPVFHNQQSPLYNSGYNGCDPCHWHSQFHWYRTGDAAQLLVGGNIYFEVEEKAQTHTVINEASHIGAFGRVYDKDGVSRTKDRPGYFLLISYLQNPQCGATKSTGRDAGRFQSDGIINEVPTFSTADRVDLNFAGYVIAGGVLVGGGDVTLHGQRFTLGYTNGNVDPGHHAVPTGGTIGLLGALKALTGGDLQYRKPGMNPLAVYAHTDIATRVVDPAVLTLVHQAAQTESIRNPRILRQLMDFESLILSLQSTLSAVTRKSYLFPKKGAMEHAQILISNARTILKGRNYLPPQEAKKADVPLLTFDEELYEGEQILAPYVTLPQHYINPYLFSAGGVLASDSDVNVQMAEFLNQHSSTIFAGRDANLVSEGTRLSETLKHTVTYQAGDTTVIKDIPREQARVIAARNITDNSVGDFTSTGVRRTAGEKLDMGSTHGNTVRQALDLLETRITRKKGESSFLGLVSGTDRTITETRHSSIADVEESGTGSTVRAGVQPGRLLSQTAAQDISGGDITYTAYDFRQQGDIKRDAVHTTAEGAFRSSSAHTETAVKTPFLTMAAGNVNLKVVNRSDIAGGHIAAHHFIDHDKITRIGALVTELRQSRSISGVSGLGTFTAEAEGGSDTMLPTTLDLTGDYIAENPLKDAEAYTIWESIIAHIRGITHHQKNLYEKAVELKSWQRSSTETSGFTAPILAAASDLLSGRNPLDGLAHSFVDSTVVGAVSHLREASDLQDRVAGGIKVANAAFADAKALKGLMTSPSESPFVSMQEKEALLNVRAEAIHSLLSRLTGIRMGSNSTRSEFRQSTAVPNMVETSLFQFDAKIWEHCGGAKLKAKAVIVPDADLVKMEAATNTATQSVSSSGSGVTVNPLAPFSSGVDVSHSEHTRTEVTHDYAGIEADYIFLRTKDMEVSGAEARAAIIDVLVEDQALLESLVDEVKETTSGFSMAPNVGFMAPNASTLSMIGSVGDFALEEKEVRRRKISQMTAFIATQQLYFEVQKTLTKRSAKIALESDGTAVPILSTVDGKSYYIRRMPGVDYACGFFSLNTTRQKGTDLLLANSNQEEIRNLVAPEIMDLTIADDEDPLMAEVFAENAEYATYRADYLAAKAIGDADRLDELKVQIMDWASGEEVYKLYVKEVIGASYNALRFSQDSLMDDTVTGTLDALAKLQGLNITIYQKEEGTGKLIQAHQFNGGAQSINLYYHLVPTTDEGMAGHFDRLEEDKERVSAAHIDETHLPEEYGEVVEEEGFKIVAPIGSALILLDNIQSLKAFALEQMAEQGVPEPKGFEILRTQEQTKEDLIANKLREAGATEDQIQQIISNPEMKKLIEGGAVFDNLYKDTFGIRIKSIGGVPVDQAQAEGKVLTEGLRLLTKAAAALHDFNEAHPHLTSFSLIALQTALSGPTQFIKSQALERTGVQGHIDHMVDAGTDWVSHQLQDRLSMNGNYADLLTQGGRFGLVVGLSVVGSGGKDKIVDAAKGVVEKVKRIHKNSLSYKGETHLYKIINKNGTHKVGESANGLNKFGQSRRAEAQARKLRKETGEYHKSEVIARFGGKRDAREAETAYIKKIRETDGPSALPGNKGNH